MLPVSDAFLAALRGSHAIAPRARVLDNPGDTGVDPPGVDLAVMGGTVTLDGNAAIRGRLDLAVTAPWPRTNTTTDLVPYGTEIAVSRGVLFGNGNVERAPLGIYRIITCEQDDAPTGPLRITAHDRMAGIVDARLLAPAQYLAGQSIGDVVEDLVVAVYPGITIEWDDATDAETLDRAVVVEEDRYAFLRDLIAARGKIFYFDYRGVLVITDPPDPSVVVWDVDAGTQGVLVDASRERTREGVFNAVVARGEALDDQPPARGYAYDLDPASVTYYDGPFGKVPRFFNSSFITTDAQAATAAGAILRQSLGLPYSVDFTAIVNPALEPFDPVRVTYPPELGRAPVVVSEVHVLDTLTIPLSAGSAMPCTTRLQTTTSITTEEG